MRRLLLIPAEIAARLQRDRPAAGSGPALRLPESARSGSDRELPAAGGLADHCRARWPAAADHRPRGEWFSPACGLSGDHPHAQRAPSGLAPGRLSAAMATVLTNDIALFIVVPLTLGLHGMATLPTARLVIFEALAVNAGSVLTPMGNPQNLFLWQRSGTSLPAFVAEMLPLAVILLATLLALTLLAFPARRIDTHEDLAPPALTRRLLWISLLLYPVLSAAARSAPGVAGTPAGRDRLRHRLSRRGKAGRLGADPRLHPDVHRPAPARRVGAGAGDRRRHRSARRAATFSRGGGDLAGDQQRPRSHPARRTQRTGG
jgi:hypothetical protein